MGLPITKKGGVTKIKGDRSYKVWDSGQIATADVEALCGYNSDPTFFNNIQVMSIGYYMEYFMVSEEKMLFLKWPNGAYLGFDVNTEQIHWISIEDIERSNRLMKSA